MRRYPSRQRPRFAGRAYSAAMVSAMDLAILGNMKLSACVQIKLEIKANQEQRSYLPTQLNQPIVWQTSSCE